MPQVPAAACPRVGHRLVDHTADVAIEADGRTPEAALEEAAIALTELLTGSAGAHRLGPPQREATFAIEAPDLPALVVAFLSELLWLHESADLLWVGGGITLERPHQVGNTVVNPANVAVWRIRAAGNAVLHDPARHGRGVEVKAVTYHGLRFGPDGDAWKLWVLLDI